MVKNPVVGRMYWDFSLKRGVFNITMSPSAIPELFGLEVFATKVEAEKAYADVLLWEAKQCEKRATELRAKARGILCECGGTDCLACRARAVSAHRKSKHQPN